MIFLYSVFTLTLLTLLAAGVVEQRRHEANLDQIGIRILVNGIRGKSSITRLCAGALRQGGLVTVAKTTGTAARFIHPNATEEPVHRKFDIPNIAEQIGIVRRAAAYQPDVLVMECMAVMPALQEINQTKLIRSTIGIISNVREDHLAEMGPTLDDVARSLSRAMPEGGTCITAERDRRHILQQEANKRNCLLVSVDPDSVTDAEMSQFQYFTFRENVAIVLAVAGVLGIDRQSALWGMWTAPPDPGVLSVTTYAVDGSTIRFANVFAANDPESTLMNIEQLIRRGAVRPPLSIVINCRPDRIERNGQMGAIVSSLPAATVYLIGHPTKSAQDGIADGWPGQVVDLGGTRSPGEILETLITRSGPDASLVAIGNIHGQGELLLEQLARLPVAQHPPPPMPSGEPHPRVGALPDGRHALVIPPRRALKQNPAHQHPTGWQRGGRVG